MSRDKSSQLTESITDKIPTDGADTVHLYDAALSDIVSTSVSDNSIAIEFNTGEVAMVSAAENTSPTFKLASGQSYVYNRETSSWREA